MLSELGWPLQRGEAVFGLGNGRMLHIKPDGSAEVSGKRELPAEAYYMMPLVVDLVPDEFMGPGDFVGILALQEKLGQLTGDIKDVYRRVGPALAAKGIPASRVAKLLLENSPIKKMLDTKRMGEDVYHGYEIGMESLVTEYYPGSVKGYRDRNRPHKIAVDTGRRRGRDGISF